MGLFWALTLAVAVGVVLADDGCPSPASISPCTCDREGINCRDTKSLQEVRKAFQANFKYGGIRAVYIQGTPLTSVPSDLFGKIKAQQFYLEINQITSVDMRAFSASNKTLLVFSLFGNKLQNFAFEEISKFQSLGTLNLGGNLLTTVPSGVLNSRSLYKVILSQNKISSIGMNAFSNLPNLGELELESNALTTLGPMTLAMKSHSAGLQIKLSNNPISEVSPSAFNGTDPLAVFFTRNNLKELKWLPFGGLITGIANKGGFMELSGNPFTCRGCDYSWLVLNKQTIYNFMPGFRCTDGRNLLDITNANIGC
ncbi:hypothetical protein JTE90_001887 [Oedothorax gibbosus]|uniref:Uncharacterized protein n=1 Tax=Oedothorax gibbosus TaxID=931172 RepID=A0AAV6VPS5_9ARAC|nr:hypothetical protein JTE90_001887 [Oedothorax gibbosus]